MAEDEPDVIEQELETIQSILEDSVEVLPKGAWGLPVIRLRVQPVEKGTAEENAVEMALKVTYSKSYPTTPPSIVVEPVRGLDAKEVRTLTQKLTAAAAEEARVCGADNMPYVFTIFQAAKELLQELNGMTNAFEQMQLRQEEEVRRRAEVATKERAQREYAAATHDAELKSQIKAEVARKARTMRAHRSPGVVAATPPAAPPAIALPGADAAGAGAGAGASLAGHVGMGASPGAEESSSDVALTPVLPPPRPPGANFSRFRADYEELGKLGKGGFGQVLKVRNRLDGMMYAIKIIKMEDPAMNKKILREVTTISRLYHRYIVRYYQAWVEGGEGYHESDSEHSSWFDDDGGDDDDWMRSAAKSTRSQAQSQSRRSRSRRARLQRAASGKSKSKSKGKGGRSAAGASGGGVGAPQGRHDGGGVDAADVRASRADVKTKRQLSIISDRTERDEDDEDDSDEEYAGLALDSVSSGNASDSATSTTSSSSSSTSSTSSTSSSAASTSSPSSGDSSDDEAVVAGEEDSVDPLRNEVGRFGLNTSDLFGFSSGSDVTPKLLTAAPGVGAGVGAGDTTAPAPAAAAAGTTAAAELVADDTPTEFLYIAMEFCEGDTLRQEKFEPTVIWTLFRQVLEALVYIHGRGVIHRDIKPDNIFLSEGNIKLGDFGLATDKTKASFGRPEGSDPPAGAPAAEKAAATSSAAGQSSAGGPTSVAASEGITTGVGTLLYRAPEQGVDVDPKVSSSRGYDQKADIFPLGIILFELWHPPFSTGMERSSVLHALRQDPPVLPDSFVKDVPASVVELIKWLLRHDVATRPTAQQVLDSPLMPHRTEHELAYMEEAVRAIAKPHGPFYNRLLEELFVQPTRGPVDYTFETDIDFYDMSAATTGAPPPALNPVDLARFDELEQGLVSVFRRHGAVHCETPMVAPKPAVVAASAKIELLRLHSPSSQPPRDLNVESVASKIGLQSAMELEAALSGDKQPHGGRPQAFARFLDSYGTVIQLPFDLCEMHARYVARHRIQQLKSFHIGRVFRGSPGLVGGQPREMCEATFDLVASLRGADASDLGGINGIDPDGVAQRAAALEVEVLTVAAEVTQMVSQSCGSAFFFRVNNAKILRGLFEVCDVPAAARPGVATAVSAACYTSFIHVDQAVSSSDATDSWTKLRRHLRSKFELPQQCVDDLKTFLTLSPMLGEALSQMEAFVSRKHGAIVKRFRRSRVTQEHRRQYYGLMLLAEGLHELAETLTCLSSVSGGWKAGGGTMLSTSASTEPAAGAGAGSSGDPASPLPVSSTPALTALLSPGKFYLDVGLSEKHGRYALGLVFQVLIRQEIPHRAVSSTKARKRRSKASKETGLDSLQALADISSFSKVCVAKGGRYDNLVCRYRHPGERNPPQVAVGVRFAVDKLDGVMALSKRRPHLRTEVLVCTLDSTGGATERLAVATQLWAQDIAAEHLHPAPASFDSLHRLCAALNILVMVIVPQSFRDTKAVKVRRVAKRRGSAAESTVDVSALPGFVLSLLEPSRTALAETLGMLTPSVAAARGGDASGRKEDEAPTAASKQASIAATNVTIEVIDVATSKNRLKTTHVDRRVAGRLSTAVLPASKVPIPVLVTDRPYKALREAGNAFLSSPDNAELAGKALRTDKRALRAVLSRMVELTDAAKAQPMRKRPPCMLLYTLDGDMFDTVFQDW